MIGCRYSGEQPLEGDRVFLDVREIRGEYTVTMTMDSPTTADSGEVRCVAVNKAGEATSTAKLNVTSKTSLQVSHISTVILSITL